MARSALGFLLAALRDRRGLSLRELGQLAEVDHTYIYRLERGAKESPSEELLTKLIRALKTSRREADMLRYLSAHTETDVGLVEYVFKNPAVPFDVFAAAAGAAFRGTARPDYEKLVNRVIRILSEEESNG